MTTLDILRTAKAASPVLAVADTQTKNQALYAMADALENHCKVIYRYIYHAPFIAPPCIAIEAVERTNYGNIIYFSVKILPKNVEIFENSIAQKESA